MPRAAVSRKNWQVRLFQAFTLYIRFARSIFLKPIIEMITKGSFAAGTLREYNPTRKRVDKERHAIYEYKCRECGHQLRLWCCPLHRLRNALVPEAGSGADDLLMRREFREQPGGET